MGVTLHFRKNFLKIVNGKRDPEARTRKETIKIELTMKANRQYSRMHKPHAVVTNPGPE